MEKPVRALPMLITLFLLVPLVEIYLLIEVGQVIGALTTVGLCVLTAVLGGILLRFQGISTMRRAQLSIARGEPPALEMLEGMALAIGGAMLLTPGFATDAVGFLCLIPWTRRALLRALLRRAQVAPPGGPGGGGPGGVHEHSYTIEGEFRRTDASGGDTTRRAEGDDRR